MQLTPLDVAADKNFGSNTKEYCLQYAPNQGLIIEFGVARGDSLNAFCKTVPHRTCYGFDWFYGLPEDWKPSDGKGAFTTNGKLPDNLEPNGEIIVGLVQDTLVPWLEKHPEKVAFVHFDLDIYSATKHCLMALKDRFYRPGSVIIFDEITGNAIHHQHELKALNEFLEATGYEIELMSSFGGSPEARAFIFK